MRNIKQIFPVNLRRRQDKLIAFYGAMHASYTPLDLIKPFEAHDAADYPTAFDVRDAAQKEFPWWSKWLDDFLKEDRALKRGSLCCLWSMQSLLKKISEDPDKDDLSMFTTDGGPITRNFYDLSNYIKNIPVDFNILGLTQESFE